MSEKRALGIGFPVKSNLINSESIHFKFWGLLIPFQLKFR